MEGKSLKILMTTDTLGGVWNYAVDLCKALNEYPVEIHLAAMGGTLNHHKKQQLANCQNTIVYESNYKLEWMDDPWQDVEKAERWINDIIKDIRPDLVHYNNYEQAGNFLDIPSLLVTHSCVLSWWRAVKRETAPAEWSTYRKTVSAALKNADVVVSPTMAFLNEIRNIYGEIPQGRIIYNGKILTEEIQPQKDNLILTAGRIWDEAKNMKALMSIAPELDWPVYVAGQNSHPVTKEVVETHNIIYLGSLPYNDLLIWMQKASIFVSPAHYEPFGLSVLEAANAGCALVLSDIPVFRELWHDAAVFANQRKPREFLQAINSLISSKKLRDKIASEAMKRSENFDSHKMGKQYFNLYNELLMSRKKRKSA